MSDTIRFVLDGRAVEAQPGETIWQAANRLGAEIPHLCYAPEPGYRPDGNCRACMVEVEGERVLAASCIRKPAPGMVVRTASDKAKSARRMVMELLIADQPAEFAWPEFDETTACGLCYTSGTTGQPKGALYHHRSTVLHALTLIMPDVMGLSARETVLPVVPMFHANAWGLPYACPLVGARMVMPGPRLDGAGLYQQFEREGVTFAAGVPTIWFGLLDHLRETGQRLTSLRRAVIGGAAGMDLVETQA